MLTSFVEVSNLAQTKNKLCRGITIGMNHVEQLVEDGYSDITSVSVNTDGPNHVCDYELEKADANNLSVESP